MKKKRTIRMLLSIEFRYDTERTELEEAEEIAKGLALRPCFESIVNGVSLDGIGIEELDF